MTLEMDITFLKGLEREKVLEVLCRDEKLRKAEEERIRKLKSEFQEIRRRGAKSFSQEYSSRSCARCQLSLGLVFGRGALCSICSHKVCSKCRVHRSNTAWKCIVCHAHGQVKVKSGEWFFEERAKKFHYEEDKHETISERLLRTIHTVSNISIVPPTPPPFVTGVPGDQSQQSHSRGFTKSMENLFWSLTGYKRKFSLSHDDVTKNSKLLTADYGQNTCELKQRSQSDTAISNAGKSRPSGSLPNINKLDEKDGKHFEEVNLNQEEEEVSSSQTQVNVRKKTGSIHSTSSTYTEPDNFDDAAITGQIEFAVQYNFKTATLEILIKACKHLASGDEKKKKLNPYVKTYLLPDKSSQAKSKTAVKKNTVNPVFNETLKYKIERSMLETRTLQVSVWHCTALKRNTFLGEVSIPLETWKFEEISTQSYNWYQLRTKVTSVR
eukprot:gi/632952830/ref/XP_007892071.1/ PREDICTED: synaptotagmin-like protein 3 isoform X1 [Callorhinchus milii]